MKPRHIFYAVLATLVIFASGVVTGGLLVRNVISQKPAPPQPGSGWQMARLDQLQRAVNQLDLTPEQRTKIFHIARERQEYVADMMRILEPDLPGLFVRMRHDINQVLTPGQRDELDRRWAQLQAKRFGGRSGEMGDLPRPAGQPFPGEGRRPLGPDGQPLPPRPNGPRQGRPMRDPQSQPSAPADSPR